MRLLVSAGGTGGGVYPALAVLQTLNRESHEILWVGSQGGMEADLVQRAGYRFEAIPAAGIHGVGIGALPGNLLKILTGYYAARRILAEYKPQVMLFTGGYVSIPVAIAGRRYPSVVFLPDIEPGFSIKLISRFADRIAVTTADSIKYFPHEPKVVVTGYPTRSELQMWTPDAARERLHLDRERRTLLVFGGSQGARSINRAVMRILPDLLQRLQVVHLTGKGNWQETLDEQAKLDEHLSQHYHPYPYLHGDELGAAFTAADLVVSRAGAATLGEFPLFGLPAILVPYPYAWKYQKVNADYLAQHGAALVLPDADMQTKLLDMILDLLDHPQRLQAMQNAAKALANPGAAKTIGTLLENLTQHPRNLKGGPA